MDVEVACNGELDIINKVIFPFGHFPGRTSCLNLMDVAQKRGLEEFLAAASADGLDELLVSLGRITVLAPTDKALAVIREGEGATPPSTQGTLSFWVQTAWTTFRRTAGTHPWPAWGWPGRRKTFLLAAWPRPSACARSPGLREATARDPAACAGPCRSSASALRCRPSTVSGTPTCFKQRGSHNLTPILLSFLFLISPQGIAWWSTPARTGPWRGRARPSISWSTRP